MKTIKILIFLFLPLLSFPQISKTLNTSRPEDNYKDLEVNTLYQINFSRILKKLKPLYTNQNLNHHARIVATNLKNKNIDTTIKNVVLIYYSDSIKLDTYPLINSDSLDLIGIFTTPHQYKCDLMVISLDKRKEQIKWKDLDCPKFMKH